jgi:hypothetical protein
MIATHFGTRLGAMSRPHPINKMSRREEHRLLNAALARLGDRVKPVRKDNGRTVRTVTTSMPWQLGHGAWVVKLEGFGAGGYDCGRVMPIVEERQAA